MEDTPDEVVEEIEPIEELEENVIPVGDEQVVVEPPVISEEKMKPFSTKIKQALLAPFDAGGVRFRPGAKAMPYITMREAMSRLDKVLPFQWEFKLGESWVGEDKTLNQKGTLTLIGYFPMEDCYSQEVLRLSFEDVGSAPPDSGGGPKKQAKQAVSDCFKRCAIHAGVGRYLYELSGVSGNTIPEDVLKKALAAVGYKGGYKDNHWGKIGGIRVLDEEDEETGDEEVETKTTKKTSTPEVKVISPAQVNIIDAKAKELNYSGAKDKDFLSLMKDNFKVSSVEEIPVSKFQKIINVLDDAINSDEDEEETEDEVEEDEENEEEDDLLV